MLLPEEEGCCGEKGNCAQFDEGLQCFHGGGLQVKTLRVSFVFREVCEGIPNVLKTIGVIRPILCKAWTGN
jgi:hypothetical protein